MEVDWDLHAVVRACCSTATTAAASSASGAEEVFSWPESFIGVFQDPFRTRTDNSIEQFLNVVNNPLQFSEVKKQPQRSQSLPVSPLSVLGGLPDQPLNKHNHIQQHQQQRQVIEKQQAFCVSRCTSSNAQCTKSKKRTNQMKRVCQVPAEGLSSDVWSWRKYGQKPIKGSPYPRGYYRCSTSKGCLARKQVERNRSDPNMFILTFTGEHNHPVPTHRNSLAGSTRTKPTSSPPVSPPTTKSPSTEKAEDNYDTKDDDNFFEGLDELVSPITGDNFPWLSTTVTSGGI